MSQGNIATQETETYLDTYTRLSLEDENQKVDGIVHSPLIERVVSGRVLWDGTTDQRDYNILTTRTLPNQIYAAEQMLTSQTGALVQYHSERSYNIHCGTIHLSLYYVAILVAFFPSKSDEIMYWP